MPCAILASMLKASYLGKGLHRLAILDPVLQFERPPSGLHIEGHLLQYRSEILVLNFEFFSFCVFHYSSRSVTTFLGLSIAEHVEQTSSRFASRLLNDWNLEVSKFWQVIPKEMLDKFEHPVSREAPLKALAEAGE